MKTIIPYTITIGLFLASCAPPGMATGVPNETSVPKTEYTQMLYPAEETSDLESKLISTLVPGSYTILSVDTPRVTYSRDAGNELPVMRIVGKKDDGTSIDTFLYLGDRPFIEGDRIDISYYPLKPGMHVTNNDILKYLATDYNSLNVDFAIEGYYGPDSLTGVTGGNLPGTGIQLVMP